MLRRRNFQFTRQIPDGAARFWISNLPPVAAPGTLAFDMPLPAWLPTAPVEIVGAILRREGPFSGQCSISIDRGSIAYLTGDAPEHQINSDFRQCARLLSVEAGEIDRGVEFAHPFTFDRSVDRFWLQKDGYAGGIYTVILSFLVDDDYRPAGWFRNAGWAEALGDGTETDPNEAGWGGWGPGYTIAHTLAPQAYEYADAAEMRFVFRAAAEGACGIANVHVDGQVMTFAGQSSVIIPAGATAATDPVPWARPGLVKFYTAGASGYVRRLRNQPAWRAYWKSGDDTGDADLAGYAASVYRAAGLYAVEAMI